MIVTAAVVQVHALSPVWSRGDYAKLEFAADLSSVFTFGAVTMKAPAPAGTHKARQATGADPNLVRTCNDAINGGLRQ